MKTEKFHPDFDRLPFWTTPDSWAGKPWHGWLVVIGRHRDSDLVDESNFECAKDQLLKAASGTVNDTENDGCDDASSVQIVSENHWAVGWVEWIAVHPSDRALCEVAQDIKMRLEDYPLLDEDDHSKREDEAAEKSWDSWARREYVKALTKRDTAGCEYPDDWTPAEIEDAITELPDSDIDALRHEAAQCVGWEYQADGSGISWNIRDLVRFTDETALIKAACEHLRAQQYRIEITKLGKALGATDAQIAQAVAQQLTLVSELRGLLTVDSSGQKGAA